MEPVLIRRIVVVPVLPSACPCEAAPPGLSGASAAGYASEAGASEASAAARCGTAPSNSPLRRPPAPSVSKCSSCPYSASAFSSNECSCSCAVCVAAEATPSSSPRILQTSTRSWAPSCCISSSRRSMARFEACSTLPKAPSRAAIRSACSSRLPMSWSRSDGDLGWASASLLCSSPCHSALIPSRPRWIMTSTSFGLHSALSKAAQMLPSRAARHSALIPSSSSRSRASTCSRLHGGPSSAPSGGDAHGSSPPPMLFCQL
mmetsp:Transcript_95707/g.270887  ORF Transcript_95707/g.270887 Transcript_95707/m.270887 type:complete len:261 (-) Transcript_95707:184-966(-)